VYKLYIAFSLITLSTNNDLSNKTTFGSQKKQIKILEISLPTKVSIRMSKKFSFCIKNSKTQKTRVHVVFFLAYIRIYSIRVFKTAACYKMTYDVFNLHITQLLYLLADITVLHTCMYVHVGCA
jgi:hypothetical protein